MLNDDSNLSKCIINKNNTGFATIIKIPSKCAGFLTKFTVSGKAYGNPGTLKCYVVDGDVNYIKSIAKTNGLSRIEDSFRIIKSDLEGRPIYVWTENHIKAHFLICFIALTIIRIIQYKILKHKNKSTLNVDGWEQGITADKIKHALNNFKACSDKNGTCLISTPENEIEQIIKSIGLEMPNLTTIDKIDKFKNTLNKGIFM